MSVEGENFYSEMAQVNEQGGVFEEQGDNNGNGNGHSGTDCLSWQKIVEFFHKAGGKLKEAFSLDVPGLAEEGRNEKPWSMLEVTEKITRKTKAYQEYIDALRDQRLEREAEAEGKTVSPLDESGYRGTLPGMEGSHVGPKDLPHKSKKSS